jgi:hypothetical protein
MGIQALIARLNARLADTSDTREASSEVSGKPAPALGCTLDTSDTCEFSQPEPATDPAQVTGQEIHQPRSTRPVADLDRWCWPRSTAMNTAEGDTFTIRLTHFASRRARGAEAQADRLVQRDRDADDRHLCVECRHCRPGPRCSQGLAALDVLQRCEHFIRHPDLQRSQP